MKTMKAKLMLGFATFVLCRVAMAVWDMAPSSPC